ncbi:MAG: exuT [Gemmataceae bacterium]|nr:exuT [Gemmataceae bacterium]
MPTAMPTVTPVTSGQKSVAPGAGCALALLLAINLFNYIDRYVLAAILPLLAIDAAMVDPTDPDLQGKLGLLSTAFMVSYFALSPLFAWLAGRMSRWVLVGGGVILWSLASGSSGLATGYTMLFLTRCLVGVGEAAYGPVAPSMISDLYPVERRGRVLSLFYMAIPVGSALGYVIGGQMAAATGTWRDAFIVTFAGGVFGLLCFLMRDPARAAAAPGPEGGHRPGYLKVLGGLARVRSFVICSAGMTCTTFILGGVAVWVPAYIFQREARFVLDDQALARLTEMKDTAGRPLVPAEVLEKLRTVSGPGVMTFAEFRDLLIRTLPAPEEQKLYWSRVYDAATAPGSITNGKSTFLFGVITVVSGFLATMLGGWLGDRLRGRVKGAYFHVIGWSTLLAWPCFLGILYLPFPWAWVMIFLTVFWLFFNTGPANTILANVTSSGVRATAFAINILVIHLFGDAISPAIIGFIADRSSLHTAFLLCSVFILLGGGLWVTGARYLDDDTRRAESQAAGSAA